MMTAPVYNCPTPPILYEIQAAPGWIDWATSHGMTFFGIGLCVLTIGVVMTMIGLLWPDAASAVDYSRYDLIDRGDHAREVKPRKVRK